MASKQKVIIDGDGGGDEMQLMSVLLAHPEEVEVLGATVTFGNRGQDQVFENTRRMLHFLKADSVKVYPGARHATDGTESPVVDDAHGSNGIGGVQLDPSPTPIETKQSADFILEALRNSEDKTVTITASGPLTNIAEAYRRDPETMKRAKGIVIMGGCTTDMPAKDRDTRRGNITYHGEFNFQQAAVDAKTVMESGLPITLLPMNCTHQLTVTDARQKRIESTFDTNPKARDALIGMMTAPRELDLTKFGIAPVMHDVNCALYLLHPEKYATTKGDVHVTDTHDQVKDWRDDRYGRTDFTPNDQSNVTVATDIKPKEELFLFDEVLSSLKTCLGPKAVEKSKPKKVPFIISVGSSITDLITYLDKLPSPGETLEGNEFETGFGGKGANQAVSASLSGARVGMISCVGNDAFGQETLQNFDTLGIQREGVHTSQSLPTGNAPIFVDKEGKNSIVVNLGANKEITPTLVDEGLSKMDKPDCLIMQCEMPEETIYHTTRYAKEHGITSILNVAPAKPVDLSKLDGLDYLVVNEHEAATVSGVEVTDEKSATAVAKKILAESGIRNVVVTLGEKGSLLVNRQSVTLKPPFPTKAVDTAGAGDAWLGCFATAISQEYSPADSMERANLFASMSVENRGTQKSYPTLAAFEAQVAARITSQQTRKTV